MDLRSKRSSLQGLVTNNVPQHVDSLCLEGHGAGRKSTRRSLIGVMAEAVDDAPAPPVAPAPSSAPVSAQEKVPPAPAAKGKPAKPTAAEKPMLAPIAEAASPYVDPKYLTLPDEVCMQCFVMGMCI